MSHCTVHEDDQDFEGCGDKYCRTCYPEKAKDELMADVVNYWPVSDHCPAKRIRYRALSTRVLAVCVVGPDLPGYYKVYIDAVPGQNHDLEVHEVHRHGVKAEPALAAVLFPDFEKAGFKYEY